MLLSKKIIQEELNKVLCISDALIYKEGTSYYFSSDQLETHLWYSTCLYIPTIKRFTLNEFVLSVTLLSDKEFIEGLTKS